MSLSNEIMNIQTTSAGIGGAVESAMKFDNDQESRLALAYKMGHRDARHAAAELAENYRPEGLYEIGEDVEIQGASGFFHPGKIIAERLDTGILTALPDAVRRKPAWTPKNGEPVLLKVNDVAWVGVVEYGNVLSRGACVTLDSAIKNGLVKPYKPGCNAHYWEEV